MQKDEFTVREFPPIDTVGLTQEHHPIRVCIVTEEIIGPVRNGGIASTYYHLSKGLAAHGHEVHVLFLKGPVVQDKTPEHWVKHFAEFGVTLHYLDVPGGTRWGTATEWQDRFMAAYRWLRDQDPFDVVHTSEWRGGLIYALMAKRMGLAFRETLFLVKTSSPHIWNRHYQMQPIDKRDLVAASYAEQKCVELADMVIGGSAHLITFMDEIGYRLPPANVFVQPNIVDFSKVPVVDQRGPREPGDIVRTQNLIFFGRLEGRKGVEMFCNAIDILRERGITPGSVTFMGKWGAPLVTQGGMPVEEYISLKSSAWECPVKIINDKNQPEALSHMCSEDMIAVMPSLIENSTMAVYETLEKRIPFIATAVGGTPELIDSRDHDACLVAPRAQDLANRLQAALRDGQPIAHPNFSNDSNLEIWYGFHNFIGAGIAKDGRAATITALTEPVECSSTSIETLGWAALIRRGNQTDHLVQALIDEAPDVIVLTYTEAALRTAVELATAKLSEHGLTATALNCIGLAAGEALQAAADALGTDGLVVCDGANVTPGKGAIKAFKTALSRRPKDFVTAFSRDENGTLALPLGGDIASQYHGARAYGPECIAMTSSRRAELGAFEAYDLQNGLIHEFVTRNVTKGADLLVIPESMLTWHGLLESDRAVRGDGLNGYLRTKPLIDKADLPLRKILLAGLAGNTGAGSVNEAALRDGSRSDDQPVWMMPVEWNREDIREAGRHRMAVGLDETENRLWLMARGPGTRAFMIANTVQKTVEHECEAEPGDQNGDLTISSFDIPDTWEVGNSFPIRWELDESADGLRTRFFRVTKLGANTYALSARRPVLSKAAFDALAERHKQANVMAAALLIEDTSKLAEDLSEISPETETFLAEAGLSASKTAGLERISRDVDSTSIDELMALAYNTGRPGLDRKMALEKSAALLAALPSPDPLQVGDLRSGLILPKHGTWQPGKWVEGWVWDRAAPEHQFTVVMSHSEKDLIAVQANTRIERLGIRTPGLELRGFRLPLPADLLESHPKDGSFDLRVAETGTLLRGGRLIPLPDGNLGPAPEPADDTAGAISRSDTLLRDLASNPGIWSSKVDGDVRAGIISPGLKFRAVGSWIEGWAWDRDTPDMILNIAVFLDDELIFATQSGVLIPSLGIRTPGLESHGFRLPVLDRMTKGALELRVVETGAVVRNGAFAPKVGPDSRIGIAPLSET